MEDAPGRSGQARPHDARAKRAARRNPLPPTPAAAADNDPSARPSPPAPCAPACSRPGARRPAPGPGSTFFFRLQRPSILAPFSITRIRCGGTILANIWRSCWLTQTTAPTPPSVVAGDGLEVHLFEGPLPLGMKETAMGADHQRDAMQRAQQAQIIHEEIDGMDVHQVVAANRL